MSDLPRQLCAHCREANPHQTVHAPFWDPNRPAPVPVPGPADPGPAMGRVALDYVSRPWAALGGLPAPQESSTDEIDPDRLGYLHRCLTDVPWLAADLEITATRQDRFPARPVPVTDGSESVMPFRAGAYRANSRLALAVIAVASVVWHRATHGQATPFRTARDAAAWLTANLRILAQDTAADEFAIRICDAHDAAITGPIEHPPTWHYLGPCEACGADLQSESGSASVQCDCGWSGDTRAVIDAALDAAADMLFTDTQLVGALELDGKVVSRNQINGWQRRGRLTVHEHKRWTTGHRAAKIITVRTYRLSEVRGLVAELEGKR